MNQELTIGTIPLIQTFGQLIPTKKSRVYSVNDNNTRGINSFAYAELYGHGFGVLSTESSFYLSGINRSASFSHSPTPSASPVTINVPAEEVVPDEGAFKEYPDLRKS